MRIEPKDRLLGYPILDMRELMRKKVFTRKGAEEVLRVDAQEAERVIALLTAEDYICAFARYRGRDGPAWETTPKGSALANAGTAPTIARAEADRIMEGFLERVRKVAGDDAFLYEAGEAVLFGSYLAGTETVNDIDLIVKLRMKETFAGQSFTEALRAKLDALAARGKAFKTAGDFFRHLQDEVYLFLKGGSEYLSFHVPGTLEMIEKGDRRLGRPHPGTPHQTVYRAPKG